MSRSNASVLLKGAGAGIAATLVQTAVGKTYDALLLPPGEDSHLAPRLVDRLGRAVGADPSEPEEWALGTAFHFGYGCFWGAGYAAVRERTSIGPWLGGALLGGLIYSITFPRWGGGVRTRTVRPPERRTDRMTAFGATVTAVFGMTTALTYEALRTPDRLDGARDG